MTEVNELSKRLTTQTPSAADLEQAALAIELHAAGISEAKATLMSMVKQAEAMVDHLQSVSVLMHIQDIHESPTIAVWRELARLRVERKMLADKVQSLQNEIESMNNRHRPPCPGIEPGGDPDAPTIPMFK